MLAHRHNKILQALQNHQSLLQNAPTVWVAYSGGLDSTVLLHACTECDWLKPKLHAIHIQHQLSPHAETWSLQCQRISTTLGVPFTSSAVNAKPVKGESPEATAREARYAALRTVVQVGDYVFTAHHADDQLETILLRLFRGTGLQGLSGMNLLSSIGPGFLLRPFLGLKRIELEAYAHAHALIWSEDESNQHLGFDRNFLRHQILPHLKIRWPALTTTVARMGQHCNTAQALLTVEAQKQLKTCITFPPLFPVKKLQNLPPLWQPYVLRQWILDMGFLPPSAKKLDTILQTVLPAAWDSTPCVTWKGAELRRYRDCLYLMPPLSSHDSKQVLAWKPGDVLILSHLGITIEKTIFEQCGVDFKKHSGPFTIRFRQGGETCLFPGSQQHRSLKHFFQDRGIPPWQRDRIPLLCEEETVIGVVIMTPNFRTTS